MSRAPFVTDRNSPVASVTTQVSRETYDRLDTVARQLRVTKSEFLRLLILRELGKKSFDVVRKNSLQNGHSVGKNSPANAT